MVTEKTHVKIKRELLDRLTLLAREEGVSTTKYVNQLLESALLMVDSAGVEHA